MPVIENTPAEKERITITLTPRLARFAKSQADQIAARDLKPSNVSAFVAGLISKAYDEMKKSK
jgi:hypothetical protein